VRKFLACAALAALAGVSLAACGGDDSSGSAQAAAFDLTQPASGDATLTGPGSLNAGAVALTFKNGSQMPVDLQLVGIDGDHSEQEVIDVFNSEDGGVPEWMSGEGGIGTVAPGQTGTATVLLSSGKFYAFASSNGDEDSPPPASSTFEVTGSSKGSLPKADATITAKEYSFDTKGLKAGVNTVKFENDGEQLHHVIAAPMADGATIDDVKEFVASEEEPQGEPPLDFEAAVSTAVIDKDRAMVTTLDLPAGKYVFMCFMTDRAGGAPHAMSGMVQEINIT